MFFAANITKFTSGGWIPWSAGALITLMLTWERGDRARSAARARLEGPMDEFIGQVRDSGVIRLPGVAVFPHSDATPSRLRCASRRRVQPRCTRTPSWRSNQRGRPHIRHVDRVIVDDLGDPDDGVIAHPSRVGFNDSQNIPKALAEAVGMTEELDFDPVEAKYFVSTLRISDHRSGICPALAVGAVLLADHRRGSAGGGVPPAPDRVAVLGAAVEL